MKLLTLRGFSAKSFRAHPKVKVGNNVLLFSLLIDSSSPSNLALGHCFRQILKAFYSLLDGGTPNFGQVTDKENVTQHHDDHIGEIHDPFEDQTQRNPYTSGRMNPYSQRKQPAPSSSSNPYQQYQRQRQVNVQTTGRFSPVPQSAPKPSTNSISPTLTEDQRKRMAENRKRALAIRMKKQNNSPR